MAPRAAVVTSLLALLHGADGSHTFESRSQPEDADLTLPGCRRAPDSNEFIFSFKTTAWDPTGSTPLEKCQAIANGLDRLHMACPGQPADSTLPDPNLMPPPHCMVHDNRMVLALDGPQCTRYRYILNLIAVGLNLPYRYDCSSPINGLVDYRGEVGRGLRASHQLADTDPGAGPACVSSAQHLAQFALAAEVTGFCPRLECALWDSAAIVVLIDQQTLNAPADLATSLLEKYSQLTSAVQTEVAWLMTVAEAELSMASAAIRTINAVGSVPENPAVQTPDEPLGTSRADIEASEWGGSANFHRWRMAPGSNVALKAGLEQLVLEVTRDPFRASAGAASRSKQVVIVTDGESLETGASDPACLGPSPAGASCAPAVAAAARRLHNHGWHVTVIAVGQQDALKLELHRQLTYPLDGGRYDATSHRWTTQHTAMASTLFNPGWDDLDAVLRQVVHRVLLPGAQSGEMCPSRTPSTSPTSGPSTSEPTADPTTSEPTSSAPTTAPTPSPTEDPTAAPSPEPSPSPTVHPTAAPITLLPTGTPTTALPSAAPSHTSSSFECVLLNRQNLDDGAMVVIDPRRGNVEFMRHTLGTMLDHCSSPGRHQLFMSDAGSHRIAGLYDDGGDWHAINADCRTTSVDLTGTLNRVVSSVGGPDDTFSCSDTNDLVQAADLGACELAARSLNYAYDEFIAGRWTNCTALPAGAAECRQNADTDRSTLRLQGDCMVWAHHLQSAVSTCFRRAADNSPLGRTALNLDMLAIDCAPLYRDGGQNHVDVHCNDPARERTMDLINLLLGSAFTAYTNRGQAGCSAGSSLLQVMRDGCGEVADRLNTVVQLQASRQFGCDSMTDSPTLSPTRPPTLSPTGRPTYSPSLSPTPGPTTRPTTGPSPTPTPDPTLTPTPGPSASPTDRRTFICGDPGLPDNLTDCADRNTVNCSLQPWQDRCARFCANCDGSTQLAGAVSARVTAETEVEIVSTVVMRFAELSFDAVDVQGTGVAVKRAIDELLGAETERFELKRGSIICEFGLNRNSTAAQLARYETELRPRIQSGSTVFEFTWRNGTKTVQRVDTILEVETVVERQEPSLESVPEIAHRAAEHCSTHGDCALTGAQEAEYCDRLSGCMPCVFCEPLLGVDDTCPAACDGLRETTQAPTTSAPTEAPATSEPTARPSDTNCWDEELRDACEAQAAVGDCGNPSPIFDVVRTTCRDTCGVCADPEFDRTPCYALPGDVILAIDVAGDHDDLRRNKHTARRMAAYLSEEENLRIGVMVYDFYNARILRALADVSSAPADVVAEAAAGTTGRAATGKAMELAEAMLANGGRRINAHCSAQYRCNIIFVSNGASSEPHALFNSRRERLVTLPWSVAHALGPDARFIATARSEVSLDHPRHGYVHAERTLRAGVELLADAICTRSLQPTAAPATSEPTQPPTSSEPTQAPTTSEPTPAPTASPTALPTAGAPTTAPTAFPTGIPTPGPTSMPSDTLLCGASLPTDLVVIYHETDTLAPLAGMVADVWSGLVHLVGGMDVNVGFASNLVDGAGGALSASIAAASSGSVTTDRIAAAIRRGAGSDDASNRRATPAGFGETMRRGQQSFRGAELAAALRVRAGGGRHRRQGTAATFALEEQFENTVVSWCGGADVDMHEAAPEERCQCEGRTLSVISWAGGNGGPELRCRCDADCHTCAFPGEAGRCTKCRNSKALDGETGECIDPDPLDPRCVDARGNGNYGRICIQAPAVTTRPVVTPAPPSGEGSLAGAVRMCSGRRIDPERTERCNCARHGNTACHACEHVAGPDGVSAAGRCTMCRHARALNTSSGVCIDPALCFAAGGGVQGNGNYGLVCNLIPLVPDRCAGRALLSANGENTGQRCRCGPDCHACDHDGTAAGVCTKCRNRRVLDVSDGSGRGQCFDADDCSDPRGNGRFNRICHGVRRTDATLVADPGLCPAGCDTCITHEPGEFAIPGAEPVCIRCGDGGYLLGRQCMSSEQCIALLGVPFGLFSDVHADHGSATPTGAPHHTRPARTGGQCCTLGDVLRCRQKLALFISDSPGGATNTTLRTATAGMVDDGVRTFTLAVGPGRDPMSMWMLTTFEGRHQYGSTLPQLIAHIEALVRSEICG